MRLRLQKRRVGEPDIELLAGVIGAPICALILAGVGYVPLSWLPACRFHRVTGWPCPSCGASRSLAELVRGHVATAWRLQPLLILTTCLALAYVLYSGVVVIMRLPRVRLTAVSSKDRCWIVAILGALVLINWAFLMVTGI